MREEGKLELAGPSVLVGEIRAGGGEMARDEGIYADYGVVSYTGILKG